MTNIPYVKNIQCPNCKSKDQVFKLPDNGIKEMQPAYGCINCMWMWVKKNV